MAAAVAESDVESNLEKTQELAKRNEKYNEFWASVSFSTVTFGMTVGLFVTAFLLRGKNSDVARACVECALWCFVFFVLNIPRHICVLGFSVPEKPKQMELDAHLP